MGKKTTPYATDDSQTDSRFEFVDKFGFTVPKRYDHDTRLDKFRKKYEDELTSFYANIDDAHYAERATTRLAPHRRIKVKVFKLTDWVTSEECLAFLRSQNAVLAGAQGLTLVFEKSRDKLPSEDKNVINFISFDEREALSSDGVPFMFSFEYAQATSFGMHYGRSFGISSQPFSTAWGVDGYLLCFCDA